MTAYQTLQRAQALAQDAVEAHLVLTIELVPIRPFAMGRYETLITVRPARGCSGDVLTETVPAKVLT